MTHGAISRAFSKSIDWNEVQLVHSNLAKPFMTIVIDQIIFKDNSGIVDSTWVAFINGLTWDLFSSCKRTRMD